MLEMAIIDEIRAIKERISKEKRYEKL